MKILIIEDEKSLLEDIKHYLTENGYNCDYSTTVKSALNKLAENKYTVALIDLDLPDGSGNQAAHADYTALRHRYRADLDAGWPVCPVYLGPRRQAADLPLRSRLRQHRAGDL